MIDDQFGRGQRIDTLRIAAEAYDGLAHGCQIDDARDAREVLHDDARRRKGDFMIGLRFRVPFQQSIDIGLGDIDAVLEAQEVFQQDLQGKGQAVDIERLERTETQDLILLRPHFERRSCVEAIRHDPSAEN